MTIAEVTPTEGAAMVAAGAYLLDVREPDEWAAGRATDAVWIALGALEARISDVPSDRQIVCICRSGVRSLKAAEFLAASGREAVNLAGGMRAWAAAGMTVADEHGRPGTII